jgi:hypothetical protein
MQQGEQEINSARMCSEQMTKEMRRNEELRKWIIELRLILKVQGIRSSINKQ